MDTMCEIVLSFLLALIFLYLDLVKRKKNGTSLLDLWKGFNEHAKTPPSTSVTVRPSLAPVFGRHRFQYIQRQPWMRTPTEPFAPSNARQRAPQQQSGAKSGKAFIDEWRKSVTGLARLADTNLASARRRLINAEYNPAIQDAAIAVENIARALLYCFGEKPEPDSGQQEALKLLIRRLKEDEKNRFAEAVDIVAKVDQNRIVSKYVSTNGIAVQTLNESHAKEIIDSASKAFDTFRKLIVKRFSTEIPELVDETCPKCYSLNVSTACFNETETTWECNTCKNKWTEPNTPSR